MPVNQALLTVVMGRSVVERVSARYGVEATDLRTLTALHCLSVSGQPVTVRAAAALQGLASEIHVRESIARLQASAMLGMGKGQNGRLLLALTGPGLRLVGLLEREERDARRRAQSVVEKRKKRAYVKSGKFVGKAAAQAERSRARKKE